MERSRFGTTTAVAALVLGLAFAGSGCDNNRDRDMRSGSAAGQPTTSEDTMVRGRGRGEEITTESPGRDRFVEPGGTWPRPREGGAAAATTTRDTRTTERRRTAERDARADAQGMTRTVMYFPTGERDSSAVMVERLFPQQVVAGQPFEYQIRVTNLTDNELNNVTVTDNVAQTFNVEAARPNPEMARNGVLGWNLGNIGPDQNQTISVRGVASEVGTINNCAVVTYNNAICQVTEVVQPALRITKRMPENALICETVPVTIEVANTGTGAARDVVLREELPEGLTAENGQRVVELDVGTLESGQTRSFNLNLRPTAPGRFVNRAVAVGANGLRAESEALPIVISRPVLEVRKSGPQREYVGAAATYEITVTNTGDGPANNVVVTDEVPRGAQFVSATEGGANQRGSVAWQAGTLAPGQSRTFRVTMTNTERGEFTNRAVARAQCAEDATAAVQTVFVGIPALLLEVVDSPDPVRVGQEVTYTINVVNQGSEVANDVAIEAALEEQAELVSTDGPTRAPQAEGRVVRFPPLARLAPGDRAVWKVTSRAVGTGDIRFAIRMNARELDRPVEETESTHFYEYGDLGPADAPGAAPGRPATDPRRPAAPRGTRPGAPAPGDRAPTPAPAPAPAPTPDTPENDNP